MARRARRTQPGLSVSRSDFERVFEPDEDPDLSYLGTYDNNPTGDAFIDRETGEVYSARPSSGAKVIHQDDDLISTGRNQYRYFNFTNHLPHNRKNWASVKAGDARAVIDKFGSLEAADLHYALEDYERAEAANRGDWSSMVVGAKVEIEIETNSGSAFQDIRSGLIGGVESDAGEAYLDDLFAEQSAELVEILRAMHVTVLD